MGTSVLCLIEELLEMRKWVYERIDGQVSAEERQARISRFSDPEGKTFIFLLSSKAGAVGLNLQAADTVILFDLDWNPQNDKQAIARAHRYGQTKEVLVVRLLSFSPIEEHMEQTQKEKLELEKKIIGLGGFAGHNTNKTPEERADLLRQMIGASDKNCAVRNNATAPSAMNEALARTPQEAAGFLDVDTSFGITDAAVKASNQDASPASVSDALVRCGRLMAPEGVPDGFEALDESDSE